MKTFSLLLFSFFCLLPLEGANFTSSPSDDAAMGGTRPSPVSEANAQAIYWVNLLDQQQYEATWLEAGNLVRDITTKEQWAAGMQATRKSFGSVLSRKFSGNQNVNALPQGTPGKFIILEYKTNFSTQPSMRETITLINQKPLGNWKVVAYSIGKQG